MGSPAICLGSLFEPFHQFSENTEAAMFSIKPLVVKMLSMISSSQSPSPASGIGDGMVAALTVIGMLQTLGDV